MVDARRSGGDGLKIVLASRESSHACQSLCAKAAARAAFAAGTSDSSRVMFSLLKASVIASHALMPLLVVCRFGAAVPPKGNESLGAIGRSSPAILTPTAPYVTP